MPDLGGECPRRLRPRQPVRVMPRVDDREAFEWPSTEKEGEDIER